MRALYRDIYQIWETSCAAAMIIAEGKAADGLEAISLLKKDMDQLIDKKLIIESRLIGSSTANPHELDHDVRHTGFQIPKSERIGPINSCNQIKREWTILVEVFWERVISATCSIDEATAQALICMEKRVRSSLESKEAFHEALDYGEIQFSSWVVQPKGISSAEE